MATTGWGAANPDYWAAAHQSMFNVPGTQSLQAQNNYLKGLQGQMQQAQGFQTGAGGAGAVDPMAANRQRITDLTEGRATALENDPRTNAALDYLQGVMSGKNAPYSDTVKNALMAQQGKTSASAEAAQMQTLRDFMGANGGSMYDPGYAAAAREAQSARQGQNLDAQGRINSQADIANFNASMQGANQLAAIRANQNAQINSMGLAGASYRAQDFQERPASGAVSGVPTGIPQQSLGGGLAWNPAQWSQPTAAPAPRPATTQTSPQMPSPTAGYYQNGVPIVQPGGTTPHVTTPWYQQPKPIGTPYAQPINPSQYGY